MSNEATTFEPDVFDHRERNSSGRQWRWVNEYSPRKNVSPHVFGGKSTASRCKLFQLKLAEALLLCLLAVLKLGESSRDLAVSGSCDGGR